LPGHYFLTVQRETHGGCTALDTLRAFVVLSPELDIPNIFTPNGDGRNDFFRPRYRGAESFSFVVSDRWGRMMFRGNEGSRGWDGLTPEGRRAAEGVYVYVVVFDEKRVYKGTVSLIR
jgi:gliding motility-associated-like protein